MVLYEHAITVGGEVEYIWMRKLSWLSGLFFINRYGLLSGQVVLLLMQFEWWGLNVQVLISRCLALNVFSLTIQKRYITATSSCEKHSRLTFPSKLLCIYHLSEDTQRRYERMPSRYLVIQRPSRYSIEVREPPVFNAVRIYALYGLRRWLFVLVCCVGLGTPLLNTVSSFLSRAQVFASDPPAGNVSSLGRLSSHPWS